LPFKKAKKYKNCTHIKICQSNSRTTKHWSHSNT
jgi:hypothetical protein